jgi:hypothetical protein
MTAYEIISLLIAAQALLCSLLTLLCAVCSLIVAFLSYIKSNKKDKNKKRK